MGSFFFGTTFFIWGWAGLGGGAGLAWAGLGAGLAWAGLGGLGWGCRAWVWGPGRGWPVDWAGLGGLGWAALKRKLVYSKMATLCPDRKYELSNGQQQQAISIYFFLEGLGCRVLGLGFRVVGFRAFARQSLRVGAHYFNSPEASS